jgi:hypothetical protein
MLVVVNSELANSLDHGEFRQRLISLPMKDTLQTLARLTHIKHLADDSCYVACVCGVSLLQIIGFDDTLLQFFV